MVSIRVERSDMARCFLKVMKDNQPVRDTVIKCSVAQNDGYELVQEYDAVE